MKNENISSPIVYLLLTLFLGPIGVHRFYRRQIGLGILYLLTGGLFFIGWIVDLINAILLILRQKNNNEPSQNGGTNSQSYSSGTFIPSQSMNTDQSSTNTSESKKDVRDSINCPQEKDGCPLAYHYSAVPVVDLNYDIAMHAASNHNWTLSARKINEGIVLYSDVSLIGSLTGKIAEMLSDWISRNDPYIIFLENINTEQHTATVFLAFYRDKRKTLSRNESTIFKLTHYKNEESQLNITLLTEGTELELEEYDNDVVTVSDIGRLPKKIAQRYIEEGASGCFFDHYDYDEDEDIYIPFVKIYW